MTKHSLVTSVILLRSVIEAMSTHVGNPLEQTSFAAICDRFRGLSPFRDHSHSLGHGIPRRPIIVTRSN